MMSTVYSIIAIDDEPLSLRLTEKMAASNPRLKFAGGFHSAESAERFLKSEPADIVILDIEMPGMNGLAFAERAGSNSKIIFSTAYEKFALEAFDRSATDYLLKPYSPERFYSAVKKAIHLLDLEKQVKADESTTESIIVQSNYMKQKIALSSITYIESFDDYIRIHLLDSEPLTVRKPLKKLLQELPDKKFIRIHRSYAVAVDKIRGFSRNKLMVGMEELPVSHLYRGEISGILGM